MSELKVNTISEVTGANGVVVDSVKLKDGGIVIADAANIGSASDTDALAISSGGVVTFTQKPVINSGVTIDNITIDGTEIDLSSGDLTLDVAGDIILDADGGDVKINDGGTAIAELTNSSTDFVIKSVTSDKDIIFKGNDGGAAITALTLDMSGAGAATFNNAITSGAVITSGAGLVIADTGNIGSASDTDAIAIAANGQVTLTQTLIGTALDISGDIDVDGTTNLDGVDIDGAVDIAGVVSISDGSGGSPSLTNTGDTNTGLFFGAADHLTVTTGGNTHTTFTGNAAPQTINVSASGGGDMVQLVGPGSGTAAVVKVIGHEGKGSSIEFFQDQGDDNADQWAIGNGAGFIGTDAVGAQDNFLFTDYDGGSTDNEAKLEHSGAWSTEGAQNASTTVDYAEFFEWKTALANDDKITETYGLTVVLDGGKVRLAEAGEEAKVLGVIRPNGTSAMVGGSHTFKWKDKYETDVWGIIQKENYTQVTWIEDTTRHSYPKDRIPSGITPPSSDEEKTAKQYTERNKYRKDKGSHKKDDLLMRKKLNSSYDESKAYVDRENRRKEWAIVGLLGQVPIRSTAIVPTSWTKMKNIETGIDLYYIK